MNRAALPFVPAFTFLMFSCAGGAAEPRGLNLIGTPGFERGLRGWKTAWRDDTAAVVEDSGRAGGEGLLSRYIGSYFPFQRIPAERRAVGDPRPAITERYPTRRSYLDRISAAAHEWQQERFLLEEDVTAIQQAATTQQLWEQ